MKLRSLLCGVVLAIMAVLPAQAATTVIQMPTGGRATYALFASAATFSVVHADGTGAQTLFGFVNLNGAAQTATLDCWDNKSAASGNHIIQGVTIGTTPYMLNHAGLQLQFGLTCTVAGTVAGGGIMALVY